MLYVLIFIMLRNLIEEWQGVQQQVGRYFKLLLNRALNALVTDF